MDTQKQTPLLESHLERAVRAHSGTSFLPEKRGRNLIDSYSEQLQSDINHLEVNKIDPLTIQSYKDRYESMFSSWLSARSGCLSTMIAGPSNFPVRRAEKANRSEERHFELWQVWREKAKKAIVRKSLPAKTFVSEIDRYKSELHNLKKNQEMMKACNVILRKAKGKDCSEALINAGVTGKNLIKIQQPDYMNRLGFPSYALTNNNANIKRIEQRIKMLQAKENIREEESYKSVSFEGGEMIMNYEEDRIQIKHDKKPSEDIRREMKSHGFRWAPSQSSWQRQITPNAIYVTKLLMAKIVPQCDTV